MAYREFHYRWQYDLQSSPEKLWPLVADTNRFNRDTGVPSLELDKEAAPPRGIRKRLRLRAFGVPIEWEETPFEWVRPSRIGVTRQYFRGPVARLVVLVQLEPRPAGGTRLTYEVWAKPSSFLGLLAIPFQIGFLSKRSFARAHREYDRLAAGAETPQELIEPREQSEAERKRLTLLAEKLVGRGIRPEIANQLVDFVGQADELDLSRIRPYALADKWNESRRAVLEACFHATRVGLLDLQWDLLCPMCRGPQETSGSLREINAQVHCSGCQIDFNVNFDRFVEVTFRPNASVRRVDPKTYCVGSPQRTPHVVAQQLLPAHSERVVNMPLEEGRYRIRAPGLPGELLVRVSADAPEAARIEATPIGFGCEEALLSTRASLQWVNKTNAEQLFVLERISWSDQAATAAEVTALQIFRDLFSTEALRPGEQISVGTLTVLFTDLRNSTQLYLEIGDATAFGRVLNHFDVLKQAIVEEDGAIVKTIGDAVMAVFREPAAALRAMIKAQRILAFPPGGHAPLTLKAGMHVGPCIAVTLNDRLDYFGSTVNMAARLECLSTGSNVVISGAIYEDPEVRELINAADGPLTAEPFEMMLKGFADERFELLRVSARLPASAAGDSA
jgi:class 3 adenylate cyclase